MALAPSSMYVWIRTTGRCLSRSTRALHHIVHLPLTLPQSGISDCSISLVECVYGLGLPQDQTLIKFLPTWVGAGAGSRA